MKQESSVVGALQISVKFTVFDMQVFNSEYVWTVTYPPYSTHGFSVFKIYALSFR